MAGPPDDTLLGRYLLDQCGEEERVGVEEHFFASDETFGRLCELEEALVERYRRGDLTRDEQAAFERAYASGARRDRRLFNLALNRLGREIAEPAATETALASGGDAPITANDAAASAAPARTWWHRWAMLEPAGVRFAFAIVAVVLALALGNELRRAAGLRSELDRVQRETLTLRQQADAVARQAAESLRREEAAANDRTRAQGSPAPPEIARAPSLVATVVLPGVTRGPGEPVRVIIPRTARTIRLQIDVDAGYATFRSELKNAAGETVARQDRLRPRTTGSARTVFVAVSSARVPDGQYELVLAGGVVGQGRFEELGRYTFELRRD